MYSAQCTCRVPGKGEVLVLLEDGDLLPVLGLVDGSLVDGVRGGQVDYL